MDKLQLQGDGFGGIQQHLAFYAVFDGHGGPRSAQLCKKHMPNFILNNEAFASGNLERALFYGFDKMDKTILSFATPTSMLSDGTTAVVAIIIGRELTVANVGDSEAILARFLPRVDPRAKDERKEPVLGPNKFRVDLGEEEVEVTLLTCAHKPSDAKEKARVVAAGGFVVFDRVQGSLAVSRALGDAAFKSPFNGSNSHFVSATPSLCSVQLEEGEHFLVIACDGLWDVFSYTEAVQFVCKARQQGLSPPQTAKTLTEAALVRGSSDNVTVIVVYF